MRILLARPRGFCAGVDRAVDIVEIALELYGPPVYVKHEIVHNRSVVGRLRERGAAFVETVEEIPEGAVTVFSAHGSPPSDFEKARKQNLRLVDAVCPLVTKVHLEARRYAREGYTILLIGHRGHVEPVGIMGNAPLNTILIETAEEARTVEVPTPEKVAYLTQTTLSVDDTKAIIAILTERFPKIVAPPSADICYATTNRQRAVKDLAQAAEVVLVIGSKNSSNSNRLREVAEAAGARAYLIDAPEDIDERWLDGVETVGVTAGASAPEDLVQGVVSYLQERGGGQAEEVTAVKEHVRFPLPPPLVEEIRRRGAPLPHVQKHATTQDMVMEK